MSPKTRTRITTPKRKLGRPLGVCNWCCKNPREEVKEKEDGSNLLKGLCQECFQCPEILTAWEAILEQRRLKSKHKRLCKHCGYRAVTASRDLCIVCYNCKSIRSKYSLRKYTRTDLTNRPRRTLDEMIEDRYATIPLSPGEPTGGIQSGNLD